MKSLFKTSPITKAVLGLMLLKSALLAQGLEQQDIFVRGLEGYHTYRIPSLLVTKKGTLLAFCEGRKNGASDTGDIDIVLKRSMDGGKTWSGPQVVWDDAANTCGNPCAVVDQKTGTVWLLLTHNFGEDHESKIKMRTARGTRTVWVSQSRDDGKTWLPPTEITSTTKRPEWDWYATGPGVGIQIEHGKCKGRLVIPCDYSWLEAQSGQSEGGSHIIFSDDHGKSWQIGGTVQPKMNECQVAELADEKGGLLLSMRNYPKGSNRAQSFSHDGGVTWSEPEHQAELVDPTCQASLLRYNFPGKNERGRILFSNPAGNRRCNLTVRLSFDDGNTWPVAKVLWEKDAAYSCLAVLRDRQIGCLYERGETNANEKITFARFTLSWLESKP